MEIHAKRLLDQAAQSLDGLKAQECLVGLDKFCQVVSF